jgi:CBS domain containing-hemolysin-like protein
MLILIILLVLLGSALFSGVEVALFSISLGKVMALQKRGKRGSKSLLKIKENISRPITVIVIFNNIVNIIGSILVGFYVTETLGSSWLGITSAVLTFLIIIFGEIIPKNIGENYAEKIGLIVAGPLLSLTKLLTPIVWLFEQITKKFNVKKNIASEEEIKILSHLGHLEGSIEKDEKEMIQNVFRLNDLSAKDIMTPRSVMVTFPGNKTLGGIKDQIYASKQSRIPVHGKDTNDIVGVCFLREVLTALAKDEIGRKVSDFSYDIMIVSDKAKVDYLLILFQKKKNHLAVVKDKYGTVLGLVSLEDVLEQLVGEIVDETDEIADLQEKARNISRDPR